MPRVKYVLLDCDNTLCLSERLAFEACTDLTNEVLEKWGKSERYTVDQLLEDFVGHNFRGMLVGLQKKHGFTMTPEEVDAYVDRELGAVTAKLSEKCTPCPGAPEQLEALKQQGYPMSVVSTSAKPRVVASLKKTGIDKYFPDEHVYSAATSLNPPSSKPDPAIYNYACQQLGVKNSECVTVEDSKSGATAAMRAGIPLIGYVGVYGIEEGQEKMEQMAKVLTEQCKANVIMYDWKEFPECLKKIEAALSSPHGKPAITLVTNSDGGTKDDVDWTSVRGGPQADSSRLVFLPSIASDNDAHPVYGGVELVPQ
ncbi:phosphoglycolate phosphatase [Xylariaceae sp. FL1651]|nr:phosphoglycolate phosphatase [Xylariaceae sp. FL1651]